MNNEAKNFINQGVAFYERRDYGSAIEKFETAMSLVESWDTEFREDIRKQIELLKKAAHAKAQSDYSNSQAQALRRQLDEMGVR
jgi:phage-related tail protein